MASAGVPVLVLVVLVHLLVDLSNGITVDFKTTATEIHANLTTSLTLTCAVGSAALSGSSNIVGRDLSGNTGPAARDVTPAIQFLTSLVVTRNGRHVASITEHTPAQALLDLGLLKVTGSLGTTSGSLTLTWKHPSDDQGGEYTCEVNGVTAQGHSEVLSRTLEVTVIEPSLKDLVQYIHNQQAVTEEQENKLTKQENEIKDLKAAIARSKHIETGVVDCGYSAHWPGRTTDNWGGTDSYVTKSQQFKQPYDKAPVVFLSIEHMYSDEEDNDYYYIRLNSVDTNHFTVYCQTDGTRINDLRLSWISIPL